jgi:hypothetical protein
MALNAVDGYAFSAVDRIFQATSMFHATSSAWPYCATMSGAALIMTGRWLDGQTVQRTLNHARSSRPS